MAQFFTHNYDRQTRQRPVTVIHDCIRYSVEGAPKGSFLTFSEDGKTFTKLDTLEGVLSGAKLVQLVTAPGTGMACLTLTQETDGFNVCMARAEQCGRLIDACNDNLRACVALA